MRRQISTCRVCVCGALFDRIVLFWGKTDWNDKVEEIYTVEHFLETTGGFFRVSASCLAANTSRTSIILQFKVRGLTNFLELKPW